MTQNYDDHNEDYDDHNEDKDTISYNAFLYSCFSGLGLMIFGLRFPPNEIGKLKNCPRGPLRTPSSVS